MVLPMHLIPHSWNHILSMPQRRPDKHVGKQPLAHLSAGLVAYDGLHPGLVEPDREALTFYMLNHLVARIQATFHADEPLPDWAQLITEQYRDTLVAQSVRLAFYLLLTTTREARHQHEPTQRFLDNHVVEFGAESPSLVSFMAVTRSKGEDKAASNLKHNPPPVVIQSYMKHLSYVFHHGHFSGGYGGHPWGGIADCLLGAVDGTYSMEVMLDLGYALAHNNGPVFNKGMLYNGYTSEFLQLLDLQRAGMLPAMVLGLNPLHHKVPDELKQQVYRVQKEIGGLPEEADGAKILAFATPKTKHWWSSKYGIKEKPSATTYATPVYDPYSPAVPTNQKQIHPQYSITLTEANR